MNKESEKLFRLAIESSEKDVASQQQSSTTDIKWLQSALQDIAGSDKLVEHLKACVATLLEGARTDTSLTDCDKQRILEEIADLCENIDVACDLHKIGGFPVVLEYLNHTNVNLRYASADVVVAVSQNNEYCQNALIEMSALSKLLELTDLKGETTDQARLAQKCLHAVSCIVRQNKNAFECFKECNGFEYLSTALQSSIHKIQLRCIFLLKNLATESLEVLKYIHEHDFLTSFLKILSNSDKAELLEFVLELIAFSCKQYQPFLADCKRQKNILAKCTTGILSNKTLCIDNAELVEGCEKVLTVIGCKE